MYRKDLKHTEFSELINHRFHWDFINSLDDINEEDKKYGVNDFSQDYGYFGRYLPIKYNGKYSMLIYSRRSGSGCTSTNQWWDKIFYGGKWGAWSADYRWNSDKPLVGIYNGKYNLLEPHSGRPMLTEGMDKIEAGWKSDRSGSYLMAEKDGVQYKVNSYGNILTMGTNLNAQYEDWKDVTNKVYIKKEWIDKGGLCLSGYGLWNSADNKLTKEEATQMLPKYSFGMGFYTLRWVISQTYGQVALQFKELHENDLY